MAVRIKSHSSRSPMDESSSVECCDAMCESRIDDFQQPCERNWERATSTAAAKRRCVGEEDVLDGYPLLFPCSIMVLWRSRPSSPSFVSLNKQLVWADAAARGELRQVDVDWIVGQR